MGGATGEKLNWEDIERRILKSEGLAAIFI